MTISWRNFVVGMLPACATMIGCERSDPSPQRRSAETGSPTKKTVYVVNYPLAYFAQRIGGDAIEVEFPGPKDEDPAFWKPDAGAIAEYQQADLILLNGASYAKWVAHATLARSKLVDTSTAFKDRFIELNNTVTHTHGPDGEHAHGDFAFTFWLDPAMAVQQAKAIHGSLARLLPNEIERFDSNFESLTNDLEALDAHAVEITSSQGNMPLLGSHPVYQYFARRYDLNLRSLHWEPDEVPFETQWAELEALLREHPARWMIWEGAPRQETVDRLRKHNVQCVVYDPCGNVPATGDYLDVMRRNVAALSPVFVQP